MSLFLASILTGHEGVGLSIVRTDPFAPLIVEKGEQAIETQLVLERAGIHIDEAANGVRLSGDAVIYAYTKDGRLDWLEGLGPRHQGSHSPAYRIAVRDRILPLDGQPPDIIRNELQKIAHELIEGTFPW
jgi:hypothetical protein